MSEWISVEDHLPPVGRDVLVCACGYMKVMFIQMVDVWPSGKKPCWYPGGLPICNSRYWMELPAPPKDRTK